MPVRNAGSFLKECLDSILQQNFRHWELIAVNDGSTDNSLAILQDYADRDMRISVLSQGTDGIIPALRRAYAMSHATWITRMDADDYMHEDKLSQLYRAAQQHGIGHLIVGQVEYFRADGVREGYLKYAEWLNDIGEKDLRWQQLYKECVIPSPCWLVHRYDLDRAGSFESNTYPEDYDLCFRFYATGLKTIYAEQALHYWRDHAARSSRNDPNYADNYFLDLKMAYFLKLSFDPNRKLVLWGSGGKGKSIAKRLIKEGIDFNWVTNNSQKIGQNIYDKILEPDFNENDDFNDKQLIIAFAGKDDQSNVNKLLKSKKLNPGKDYFFFA